MRTFRENWLKVGVAREMWRIARTGTYYDGIDTPANRALLDRSRGLHFPTSTSMIFTRDAGMHTSGWWKNPDYERCWHLSLSFVEPLTWEPRPKDWGLSEEWIEAFYGDDKRYLWAEPPYTDHGKKTDVWHYRLFCDPAWKPILPRGEVYSKDHTPAHWKSYSDLQDHKARLFRETLLAGPGEQ